MSSEEVQIGTAQITEAEAESLMAQVDAWNSSHGFYPAEEKGEGAETGSGLTGNMGYTWFRLSTQPEEGENIVLNFSFDKGDKSIALARSYRFEFNESNWEVPAFAVFKLDPKLSKATSASFTRLKREHPLCLEHGICHCGPPLCRLPYLPPFCPSQAR